MSLRLPAMEKETDEATDQPPGIQPILVVSPSAVPMGTRIPTARTKPQLRGATKDGPRNY